MHLIVVKPFERFVRGDIISDKAIIQRILSSEHASFVIRITDPNTAGRN
jgi:hypothetical protein